MPVPFGRSSTTLLARQRDVRLRGEIMSILNKSRSFPATRPIWGTCSCDARRGSDRRRGRRRCGRCDRQRGRRLDRRNRWCGRGRGRGRGHRRQDDRRLEAGHPGDRRTAGASHHGRSRVLRQRKLQPEQSRQGQGARPLQAQALTFDRPAQDSWHLAPASCFPSERMARIARSGCGPPVPPPSSSRSFGELSHEFDRLLRESSAGLGKPQLRQRSERISPTCIRNDAQLEHSDCRELDAMVFRFARCALGAEVPLLRPAAPSPSDADAPPSRASGRRAHDVFSLNCRDPEFIFLTTVH